MRSTEGQQEKLSPWEKDLIMVNWDDRNDQCVQSVCMFSILLIQRGQDLHPLC